jgi:hypothetical protein
VFAQPRDGRKAGLVEDLDLSIAQPEQPLGFEAFQDLIDAGAPTTDEIGDDTLAEMNDTVLRLTDQNEGDLSFEAIGEKLDQTGLGAGQASRDRQHPPPGKAGSSFEQTMKGQRVNREDDAVLESDSVEGLCHPEEKRDVPHHVAGPKNLKNHLPAPEVAGQLDGAAADDVDTGGRLARPEQDGPSRVVVLAELRSEPGHVLWFEGCQIGTAQAPGDPDVALNRQVSHVLETRPVAGTFPASAVPISPGRRVAAGCPWHHVVATDSDAFKHLAEELAAAHERRQAAKSDPATLEWACSFQRGIDDGRVEVGVIALGILARQ